MPKPLPAGDGTDASDPDLVQRVPVAGCTLRGTALADVLNGSASEDVLCGLDGNDRMRGGAGRDSSTPGRVTTLSSPATGTGTGSPAAAVRTPSSRTASTESTRLRTRAATAASLRPGLDRVLADRRDLVGVDWSR